MGGWKHDLGQGSSHSGIKFPAILLLPRDAFTYKVFYTGRGPSHRDDLMQRVYKGKLLLTNVLTQRYFQHRDAFTHGCLRYKWDDFAKRNF